MAKLASLFNWLDHRTGYRHLVHEALYERIPGGARWRYVWGSTLVFTFFIQVVTGLFLWMAYSPSAHTAWESVFYIQTEMQGGWLLRGLHHFTAQAMVVLLVLHLMQIVIDGAYRAPREVNFWVGLVLMLIVFGLALTGYLLPWDQKGYWATRVATNLMGLVSPKLPDLVVGGSDYGNQTLTRFFALHAGVLPLLLIMFLVIHIALLRRHGVSARLPLRRPEAMFWPDQALKDAVACLAVLAAVLFLIVRPSLFGGSLTVGPGHLGAELGAPADPTNPYAAARPEWYFLFLFQFLKLFEGHGASGEFFGAIVVPGVVVGIMFLMPLVGRWKLGHVFNVGYLFALLIGIGWLTYAAYREDHRAKWITPQQFADQYGEVEDLLRRSGGDQKKIDNLLGNDPQKLADFARKRQEYDKIRKSEDYLQAVALAEQNAERAKELAGRPERIPPSGALTLLRHDPQTQGRRLFERYCSSCHTHLGPDAPETLSRADQLARSTAPDLANFASRGWLGGLLDPKQIVGPHYFGNTEHKKGDMVGFVTGKLQDAKLWTGDQRSQAIAALSAEAKLPTQTTRDRDDQALIQAGRVLIADKNRCAACHRFHDPKYELGEAPDLTDYGSRTWLTAFISDPSHERFYGGNNDRMPAFAPDAKNPQKNLLTPTEIGYLVDWLRGDDDAAIAASP
jgi:ubiquinol-cytochrome c reductase cytochrome b subunit